MFFICFFLCVLHVGGTTLQQESGKKYSEYVQGFGSELTYLYWPKHRMEKESLIEELII